MPVRLVKGAYWDSEIKRSQVEGLAGYPVLTRKPNTDVSYLACARKMLGATDALYPMFATHNAHTIVAIHHVARQMHGDWTARSAVRHPTNTRSCTAWAMTSTAKSSARTSSTSPVACMRPWVRTRTCCRTSCAGCLRTAPTPASSIASPMRTCPRAHWSPTQPIVVAGFADPPKPHPHDPGIPTFRCPARCSARRGSIPWASISPTTRTCASTAQRVEGRRAVGYALDRRTAGAGFEQQRHPADHDQSGRPPPARRPVADQRCRDSGSRTRERPRRTTRMGRAARCEPRQDSRTCRRPAGGARLPEFVALRCA